MPAGSHLFSKDNQFFSSKAWPDGFQRVLDDIFRLLTLQPQAIRVDVKHVTLTINKRHHHWDFCRNCLKSA